MSADNWAICPKCKQLKEKGRESLARKVEESYGKISASEWLEAKEKLDTPTRLEQTLREDYEIGISEDGGFYVRYEGHCRVCDFHYEYQYDDRVTQ